MKTISAIILLVSSWRSVHGCQLATCTGQSFDQCPGWSDQECRDETTLNLANKGLYGPITAQFYQLYGTQIDGDAAAGIKAVELTTVDLQDNTLTGTVSHILDCPTLENVNLKGNQFGSEQTLNTNADGLKSLNIAGTSQTDVNWLNNKAPNLEILNLANNQISNLSPITTLTKLTTLDLSGNTQITDLTVLAALTSLTTLTVDPALQQQSDILTSGGTPETKRSALIAASISKLSAAVDVGMQGMTQRNLDLESRVAALERKLAQLNSACLVGDGGFTQPIAGDDDGGYSNPSVPDDTDSPIVGGRRLQQGSDCIPADPSSVVDSGSATGLVSAAAIIGMIVGCVA